MEQMEQLRNEWRAEASESEEESEDEGEEYDTSDRVDAINIIREGDMVCRINLRYKDNQRYFYGLSFQNANEPEKIIHTRLSPSEYDEMMGIMSRQNLGLESLIQCFNTIDTIHMEGARF